MAAALQRLFGLLKRGRLSEAVVGETGDRKEAHGCASENGVRAPSGTESSAKKRRRLIAPAAAAAAAAADGAGPKPLAAFNFKVNPLFGGGHVASNPLFSDDDEDGSYDMMSTSSNEGTDSYGSISNGDVTSSGGSGRFSSGFGRSLRQWDGTALQLQMPLSLTAMNEGSSMQSDGLMDTLDGCDGDRLAAFRRQLLSAPVLSALVGLESAQLHPFKDGSLSTTIAGMLVLCRRANLADDELAPDVMLTLLWLLEGADSQYRCDLSCCLGTYLRLLPIGRRQRECMRRRMLGLQLELLQRCGWRVVLLDKAELLAAQAELEAGPSFSLLRTAVQESAHKGQLPSQPKAPPPSPDPPVCQSPWAAAQAAGGSADATAVRSALAPRNR